MERKFFLTLSFPKNQKKERDLKLPQPNFRSHAFRALGHSGCMLHVSPFSVSLLVFSRISVSDVSLPRVLSTQVVGVVGSSEKKSG